MTLQAEEFIRRFLLHVLPEGFQRIRYYGFLANRSREQKLTRCRELLGMPAPGPAASETSTDYSKRYEELPVLRCGNTQSVTEVACSSGQGARDSVPGRMPEPFERGGR